jgi:hypothetical protein
MMGWLKSKYPNKNSPMSRLVRVVSEIMAIPLSPCQPVKPLAVTGEGVILQLSLRLFSVIFQKDNINGFKHSADKLASQ